MSFDSSSLLPGDYSEIYFSLEYPELMSGEYEVHAKVQIIGESNGRIKHLPILAPIINRDDIGFGPGWNLAGIERLLVPPSESEIELYTWVRPNGSTYFFHGLSTRAQGDISASVLESDGATGYILTDKYGTELYFDSEGRQTERIDRNGNETDYLYVGGYSNRIQTIEKANGHVTSFVYTGDHVSEIHDYADRITFLSYDEYDQLIEIELPAPDGSGQGNGPVTSFTYYSNGDVSSVTDADGSWTGFEWDSFNDALTVTYISSLSGVEELYVMPIAAQPLTAHPVYQIAPGIYRSPVWNIMTDVSGVYLERLFHLISREGRYVDELGRISTFEAEINGYFTFITQMTDPLGNTTYYERNDDGLVTKMTSPAMPEAPNGLDTYYSYDNRLNLAQITYPDLSTDKWEYDSVFSQITRYTDAENRVVKYTIDPENGDTVEMIEVIGQVGGGDDIVTQYTYTPQGFIERIIEPIDITFSTTTTTYYQYTQGDGWLDSITYDEGGIDQATIDIISYDDAGNPTRIRDEVGRDTVFVYDDLDQLIEIRYADPDGVLMTYTEVPVSQYQYSDAGYIQQTILTTADDQDNPTTYGLERNAVYY